MQACGDPSLEHRTQNDRSICPRLSVHLQLLFFLTTLEGKAGRQPLCLEQLAQIRQGGRLSSFYHQQLPWSGHIA